jgi:alcohol dehydrogenase (NADP+)/uncharacterized zinc-type alcohol dehydrogenase-like protein
MKSIENHLGRRKFLHQSALAGAGLMLASPASVLSQLGLSGGASLNIKSKGYASMSDGAPLTPWSFERRPVGDDDVLLDVKYSSICHSDIHTIRGHWGDQPHPLVPGHEIAGIVAAVGKNVTKFKVGDKAGVGCMVDSCMHCDSCLKGEEQYCDNHATVYTYSAPDKTSPSGITQGGYSNNIVVKEHFVIRIPDGIDLQHAAPLLCAGITTYSPLMRAHFKEGDKVGVAGIGGLGHIAIQLAKAKGAEVYAFTTTEDKMKDAIGFGAKEAIYVNELTKLQPYRGKMDYMISTIPYDFDISSYSNVVKPYGSFTQVGVPIGGKLTINNFMFVNNRVHFNGSLIGGIPETQEMVDFCASNKLYPQIQIINAGQINEAYDRVINKQARYRYVIDASTF